jgi:hypothetical protein
MVIKRCPTCGYVYDGSDSVSIGKPFLDCPDCKSLIIDTDSTEWELKSSFGKVAYVASWIKTCLAYGSVFAAAAFALIELLGFDLGNASFISLCVVTFICCAIYACFMNLTDIRESRKRRRDPHYRLFLIQIGLLKG